MNKKAEISFTRWLIITILLILIFFGLIIRIIYLGSVQSNFLKAQGSKRVIKDVALNSYRGKILDRNGNLLAISVEAPAVWVNPKQYVNNEKNNQQLSQILERPLSEIIHKVQQNYREFVYLKRAINEVEKEAIKKLKIPGIFLATGYRRFYPEGESIAPIIGLTNIDDQGQEGIELLFDHWLRGIPGQNRVLKDCLGNVIQNISILKSPVLGQDLVISIDRRLQYFAYQELKKVVQQTKANAGIIVALSVKTGEILAMVNYPSFDPNLKIEKIVRNRAVTDLYEPGSTFKTFTILEALASGRFNENTLIDTNPGEFRIGNNIITDAEKINNGVLSLSEVLIRSSDIGTAKVILQLDSDHFLNTLHKLGFGQRINHFFPGESAGKLPDNLKKRPFVLATLSFGYSVSLTAVQLAAAYATLGAKGLKRVPTFVKQTTPRNLEKEERLFSQSLCERVLKILERAVEEGTGRRARIKNYRVAGKTGTSHMISPKGGYDPNRYYASFAGIAPVSNPEIAMVVVVIDPKTQYFGSQVAAPLFGRVMEGMLRILAIEFDKE